MESNHGDLVGLSRCFFLKRRLVLGAAIACVSGACAPLLKSRTKVPGPLFSFVFSNDLHVSSRADAEFLRKVVNDWQERDEAEFVVIGGDLVNNGTAQEFKLVKRELDRLKKTTYLLSGNHDVTGRGPEGRVAMKEVFPGWKNNMLIHYKGIVLIFLDTTDGPRAHTTVPTETATWLRQVGARIAAHTPVIVFTHFSLHPDVPRFPVKGASALFDVLDDKNVLAFFSGHYHAYWEGYRNGAVYYTNTCVSRSQGNHDGTDSEGYLLVDVYTAGVKTKYIEVPQDFENSENVDLEGYN